MRRRKGLSSTGGQTVCGTAAWITELLVNPVKSHICAQSTLSDRTFFSFSIEKCFSHTVLDTVFCVALPALYSVNSRLPEQPTATVQSLSLRLHEQLRWRGESSARLLSWARASTLLRYQIMPVFISGVINGLGPMKAESTKDSFGNLTIFYV